jgi:hypothetical protein
MFRISQQTDMRAVVRCAIDGTSLMMMTVPGAATPDTASRDQERSASSVRPKNVVSLPMAASTYSGTQ